MSGGSRGSWESGGSKSLKFSLTSRSELPNCKKPTPVRYTPDPTPIALRAGLFTLLNKSVFSIPYSPFPVPHD